MAYSGVKLMSRPSICDRSMTPCSDILLSLDNEKTWNPPESVRMGLSHFIHLCKPPILATRGDPGLSMR